jgi:hypothetical protein
LAMTTGEIDRPTIIMIYNLIFASLVLAAILLNSMYSTEKKH